MNASLYASSFPAYTIPGWHPSSELSVIAAALCLPVKVPRFVLISVTVPSLFQATWKLWSRIFEVIGQC